MKKITLLFILTLMFGFCFRALAQQDPVYAQYMNNPLVLNPAYAGSNNMLNAGIQYRTQWAGIESNPVTVNASSHLSVIQNKVGIGLSVIQDQIGDTKNTEFNSIYSYKIKFSKANLSFGMQTGLIRYTIDPARLTIRDSGDPSFNSFTETKFNLGAGLLLKSDHYIIGLSVPRLLPATVSQGGQSIQLYDRNYYLYGAYALFLSDKLRLKPSVLLRAAKDVPLSADINASMVMHDSYTAGIFTRNFKTYGLLVQAMIKNFRLGYVFELPGNSESSLHFVSHEFTIGIATGVFTYHDQVAKIF